jgi:predicted ATPase
MVEMMAFKDFEEGYRCGELALKLFDALQCPELTSRVYSGVHGFLKCYKEPLRDALKPLDDAYRLNILTGDVEVRLVLFESTTGLI